jgi:predicted RNA-binding protein with PUA domain
MCLGEEEMIYVVKRTKNETFLNVKGCTFVRVALLSPEEVEDLLREEIVAASEEAAEMIKNTFGVKISKVFQGNPPVQKGDKVILLGPNGQAVDITLVW